MSDTDVATPDHVATARELASSDSPKCSSCDRPVNPFTGECAGCSD
jgi:hypothetical protein